TGLALKKSDLLDLFPNGSTYKDLFAKDNQTYIRIHSSELDDIFGQILYSIGSYPEPRAGLNMPRLFKKYCHDKKLNSEFSSILKLFFEHHPKMLDKAKAKREKSLDPTAFMTEATEKFGKSGLDISCEIIDAIIMDMHSNLLSNYKRFEFENIIDLEDLFKSESLETKYGKFIDQRYIDYLYKNQNKLSDMNWRKFEGLTAEYFCREGYKVELGPGRNDGGVDIRVWKDEVLESDPPLILIQCKRHQNKIDRTVVKALWADVSWENADSGLVVTTSSLSPGAQKDCIARGYNIKQADKKVIGMWLQNMRTPGTGIFLGT
ncbi:MAG: restriction endonuclease, partial [Pseudomonadota bacterium]